MPLEITLQHRYASIRALTCPELPDFAVLTGRNGAGKTQLLQALKNESAIVKGIPPHEIESYDLTSFRIPNSGADNSQTRHFAKTTAQRYLEGDRGTPPIAVAAEIFEHHVRMIERDRGIDERNEFVRSLRQRIEQTPDFQVFPTTGSQAYPPYDKALYDRVMNSLNHAFENPGTHTQYGPNSFNNNPAALITLALKRTGDGSKKTEFADHIQRNGTHEYFVHLTELHAVVVGLLDAESDPGGSSDF